MHCFCECRPSLTTLIVKSQDSNKAMVCTHKINPKKEYGFLKQKKIGMEVIVFFSFKNPYPFHNHPTINEHFRLVK